jgi:thiamine pyrophosphate-dependent acetolactate synthase large subunit-like protein
MKQTLLIIILLCITIFTQAQNNNAGTIESDEIFTIVKKMPEFGKNKKYLQEYIKKNSRIKTSIKRTETSNNVFVKLIIEQDGTVTFNGIARGENEKLNTEAKRIVENMPKWKPGSHKGKPKRVAYMIPFWFIES